MLLGVCCRLGLLLWVPGVLASAGAPFLFETMGVREGLSQNTVLDVFQDSQGFLWLATENGLNRYNGYEFTHYYRDYLDPGGLRSDYIWAIAEDSQGDLWLATNDAGVVRWDRETGKFSSRADVIRAVGVESRRRATAVHVHSDSRIWVGTDGGGVYVLNRDGSFHSEFAARQGMDGQAPGRVTSLIEDESGAMLIGTLSGLFQVDPSDGLRPVNLRELGLPATLQIASLLRTRGGGFWLGTSIQGVWQLDSLQGPSRRVDLNLPEDGSPAVQDLLEDRDGRIWIATADGLWVHEPDAKLRRIRHDRADPHSIASDDVMSLDQDETGMVWIGTRGGGVSWWNSRSWSFGPRSPQWLSGTHVNAFADADPAGEQVWMGTIGRGLVRLSAEGQRIATFAPEDGYPALADDRIMSLLRDDRGRLWIGTLSAGLYVYDPANGAMRHHAADPAADDALRAPGIMSLLQDSQGRVWVGAFNGGVAWVDADGRLHRVIGDEALNSIRPTAFAEDNQGRVWVGTDGAGLLMLQPDGRVGLHLRAEDGAANGLRADSIYAVAIDELSGDVWIGTAGHGLGRLSAFSLTQGEPRFRWLTNVQGLSSNVIYAIHADASGELWLSSNYGLMQLEPLRQRVRVYHREHGLYGDEFNFGAHHLSAAGRMYFGGLGGFNFFDPSAIELNTTSPKLALTDFQRFGESEPRESPIFVINEIELAHGDDVVAFEFALLDFAAPRKNVYSFKLEGFDRSWSKPDPRRRVTYTNLDPGSYFLKVRGANSDGVWADRPLWIRIVKRPALWATWWAYAAYLGAGLLLIAVFLRWKLRAQERQARFTQLAFYDRATGVPNRHLFQQRVEEVLARARAEATAFALLALRVSVPRNISDALGHAAYEDVMRTLAARFMRVIHGSEDSVGRRDLARMESDMFAAYIMETEAETAGLQLAARLRGVVAKPLVHEQHRVPVSLHIGLAVYPQHAGDTATLLRFASTAASTASDRHQTGIMVYDRAMTARAADRVALESRLSAAIDDDQLQLYFQPRYDSDDRVTGAEALLRWHDDQRGWVSPSEFVPLAEQSDLIHALDSWVIRRICRTLRQWFDAGQETVPIAINLSAANLGQPAIVETLIETCREYHVPPEALEVELTESAVVADVEQVRDSLLRLKQAGFSVALDDFGTGYSSLTHLKEFSIDTVKIDREFVRDVDKDDNQASICGAIAALANSLRMRAVAEGVETQAQWQTLQALGCHEMQGFLKSPAVSEEGFLRHLHNRILPEELPASGT